MHQVGYLDFTQGYSDLFSSVEQSSNDYREIRSNIMGSIDNDTVFSNGYEVTTNFSDSHVILERRGNDMAIGFC